ncbi:MAG TPA: type IV secretory system conjugative DNA transfer family protein [Rhizomicrobium sp.]|nr:type IV secretory system conjugative DNA transfer family protein [Rhizomicrobium sp.]
MGGTRDRELRDTRQRWEEAESAVRASPLGTQKVSDLCISLVRDIWRPPGGKPALSILIAICEAVAALYRAEDIGEIEVCWPIINTDVAAAVAFREMTARRRRWALDFANMNGAFGRIVIGMLDGLAPMLPPNCFGEWESDSQHSFETPLIDLLEDPADVVDRLFMLPYDDESFRLNLFFKLRDLCARNVLIASGFLPTDDPHQHRQRLIRAPDQKGKTGAELSSAYLSGSPLKELLDFPVPFRIPEHVRFEHCHIVGGTGHGKTQLMQKMIHADLVASREDGRSIIVVDSQGDLINKLAHLDLFSFDKPDSLADRLVLIDPADVEFPAALNLFDAHTNRTQNYSAADRERVLNGVVELYELFFGTFLGAELTQKQGVVFKYLARLMLVIPGATIHTLMQIMEDGSAFKPCMQQLDGSARYFFETEFFHPAFAATKKQVLRRLWGVLSTPAFERMFTQKENKLDLFEAMNEGKIILVSTAKDLLKSEGSQLLGRFMIAMVMQAALERSTLPEHLRRPCFVYVDEAQEYFDDSIETILSQARKYHVGITLAHQTLDQLSPRLRSAMLANTSIKCAGGVSAKDARMLSDELRTTSAFIEGMKRRGPRSEFAVWVKNVTGQAIRLSVPLGSVESQPTLDEDEYSVLIEANRTRYCGTLADIPVFEPVRKPDSPSKEFIRPAASRPDGEADAAASPRPSDTEQHEPVEAVSRSPLVAPAFSAPRSEEMRDLGKGGRQHRYLQALVKEIAEQSGLKATIEAPLPMGSGQVDVLLERDGMIAAIEISVTTPIEHERDNLRKCLACDFPRIGIVIAKSKRVQASYRQALSETVAGHDRERVSYLTPEDLPAFIAALAPVPEPSERVVKGYRVKGALTQTSTQDAQERQEALAKLVAKSMRKGQSS